MSFVSRFILNVLKENKKEAITITIVATIGSLLSVAIPYVYGKLFDLAVIPNTTLTLLFSLIFVWLAASLISNYTSNKEGYLGEILGAKVAWTEEAKAYGHFLTLPIAFHKNKKTGEILNKISRGSWQVEGLIINMTRLLPQLIVLVGASVIIFIAQWQLALILIFSFLVYIFITIKSSKEIVKSQEKFNKLVNEQYGKVYDKLYNPLLVKNFAMEEAEKKNILNQFAKILPAIEDSSRKYKRVSLYQGVVYSLSFITLLSCAIFFLRKGNITAGQFIMFFGYTNLVFSPLWTLTEFYKSFKKASDAIKRIARFKLLAPEAMKHGNRTIEGFKGEIKFSNVKFEYTKGKLVLNGINLKINAGQSIALVGQSGVGKSTLSELMLGYYQPSRGDIFLDGVDISELNLQWIREQMAIVPQDLSILNDTLIKNIKYANPKATYEEVVNAAKAAGAHDFIMKLPKKYDTLVGERGVRLSMGQKQRIALTMAFLKNPKILILDEPTSALDAESERIVQEGIKKLIQGRTTVIIAHRFSTVKHADKIVVLDKGKIIEEGNHNELIRKKGKYYHLYNLQMGLD
jgi:ABC-type multidrug transport system fused ATPase/permease subunit